MLKLLLGAYRNPQYWSVDEIPLKQYRRVLYNVQSPISIISAICFQLNGWENDKCYIAHHRYILGSGFSLDLELFIFVKNFELCLVES
jgi:hypothetical protein